MKKNRKREFNNINFSEDQIEYYGLRKDDGRIKVDIKRLRKLNVPYIDTNFLNEASQIPRNTVYFLPNKVHKNDYVINIFRGSLDNLQKQWYEIKKAFSKVRSPRDVYENVVIDAISEGYGPYEVEELGMLAAIKRDGVHKKLWASQCAQFIHQMATELDALLLKGCIILGYDKKDVTRGSLHDYLNGTQKGNMHVEALQGYEIYTKFFTIWNLMKHNSPDLFYKVKNKYPDMLTIQEYSAGEMSQYYLRIGDEYIECMLKDLLVFYENLCINFFNENTDEAKWNYDDYFLLNIQKYIEEINNPLGI